MRRSAIISYEHQLITWLLGMPMHNGVSRRKGECVPDFSCCYPSLMIEPKERLRLILVWYDWYERDFS